MEWLSDDFQRLGVRLISLRADKEVIKKSKMCWIDKKIILDTLVVIVLPHLKLNENDRITIFYVKMSFNHIYDEYALLSI